MFRRPICNYSGESKELLSTDRVIGSPIVIVTQNTNVTINTKYGVNTTSNAVTLTLPATATQSEYLDVFDYSNTFGTNNCTIARNGHKIEGLAENLILNVSGFSLKLMYIDATVGFKRITS